MLEKVKNHTRIHETQMCLLFLVGGGGGGIRFNVMCFSTTLMALTADAALPVPGNPSAELNN